MIVDCSCWCLYTCVVICFDFCYVLSCQNPQPKYSTSRRLSVPGCPNTLFNLYRSAFGGGSGGCQWARSLPFWGMKSLPQKKNFTRVKLTFDDFWLPCVAPHIDLPTPCPPSTSRKWFNISFCCIFCAAWRRGVLKPCASWVAVSVMYLYCNQSFFRV